MQQGQRGRLPAACCVALPSAKGPRRCPAGQQGYRGWNVADAKGLCLHAVEYPPHDDPERLMFGEGWVLALESDQD